jgi:hypothetical protein
VQFGNITDQVNTFVHTGDITPTNSSPPATPFGASFWAGPGNQRFGAFYSNQAPYNVQVDIISKYATSNSIGSTESFECYLQGRNMDDTTSYIRLQNGTSINGLSVPAIVGFNNYSTGTSTANFLQGLVYVGKVNAATDATAIAFNPIAITEWDSRISTAGSDQTAKKRLLFNWKGVTNTWMTMNYNGRLGIGTLAGPNIVQSPGNRLVISSQPGFNGEAADPYWANTNLTPGATGSSGLRFARLRCTNGFHSMCGSGIAKGVLSVDANGDVIYVNATQATGLNLIGTNDIAYGFPTGERTGIVSIGDSTGNAKLNVIANAEGTAIYGNANATSGINRGVYGQASNSAATENYGVFGQASEGTRCYGGYFDAFNAGGSTSVGSLSQALGANPTGNNYGAWGTAGNTGVNYGVRGNATANANSSFSVGVYGEVSGSTGARWAIYANGDAFSTGTWQSSDAKLKNNIVPITNAVELLAQLQPKTYTFERERFSQLNLPDGTQSGLLAQDLEALLPEAVKDVSLPAQFDASGKQISEGIDFKAINYTALIPYVIQAINEQNLIIEEQSKTIAQQIAQLTALEQAIGTIVSEEEVMQNKASNILQHDIVLGKENQPMLGFASPNPNTGAVFIDYFIPQDMTGSVEILFTDASGRLVNSVPVKHTGSGRLNIDTHALSQGVYQYTLVIDGVAISTKRMIRA